MTPERLQELLNAFVDDQLDAQGQRELARALETDGEARRAFVRATDQHQALRDLLGHPAAKQARAWKPWAILGAIAAVAMIALLFQLMTPEAAPPKEGRVATPERKPTPTPPPPKPEPPVRPPEPPPVPPPIVPLPEPPAPPKEPEKPPPVPPEPKPPQPKREPPPTPAPTPPKETAVAVATVESVRGEVLLLAASGRKVAAAGQVIASGQGVSTGAGETAAVIAFPDGTRLALRPGTTVEEISAAAGKRLLLAQGSLAADVVAQPAGQPMVLATRHAEATILGTRLGLSCSESTKLEVKEGEVRFTRLEDKRVVTVGAGYSSVAAKGTNLTPRKTTRGSMMAGMVLWGEDFQEPEEIDNDWSQKGSSLPMSFAKGALDIDCAPLGDAWLSPRAPVTAPLRISVDVELTQRPNNILVGLRLQSSKVAQDHIHLDMDEDRYYLRIAEQNLTADLTRKTARRERWTLDLAADGSVTFLVDGKTLLKGKRLAPESEYRLYLMTKASRAPGLHVRFDNFLLERVAK